jgi:hypothetical protein
LQLGDDFLSEWADRAVQSGERDADYEGRIEEWRRIRPLLQTAPSILQALRNLMTKADDLISAIDGGKGCIEAQTAELSEACTAADTLINSMYNR